MAESKHLVGDVDMPFLTAEGAPLTALYLEPDGRVMARSSDGRLWRSSVQVGQQIVPSFSPRDGSTERASKGAIPSLNLTHTISFLHR